jgi:hypothetical protein
MRNNHEWNPESDAIWKGAPTRMAVASASPSTDRRYSLAARAAALMGIINPFVLIIGLGGMIHAFVPQIIFAILIGAIRSLLPVFMVECFPIRGRGRRSD